MILKKTSSIMIVDDDRVQHMINRKILLRCDPTLKLYFFDNPLEALEWLNNNSADLLLLDINMPEMKGWEFLEIMTERGIDMEVKMLSSSIDPRDIDKSKKFDLVSGFLVKPLNNTVIDELLY